MNRPPSQRCLPARSVRGGFTMVELLMVIIIIAILTGLLLPVINGAMKTARKAAVLAEINQFAQAMANFKSKYGDYPPSRFLAVESGNYGTYLGSTALLNGSGLDPTSPADGDITVGQLAQRSVAAIRKFWPRVNTSTTAANTVLNYDFNGNNTPDGAYVLHGHECLVFFLGGIPAPNSNGSFGMIGFDKNPLNPFTNITANSANRQPPLYEFNAGRLFLDPFNNSQVPGYYDSLGNSPPPPPGTIPTQLNFYSYFSSYGNNGYDPNDVNFYSNVIPAAQKPWLEVDASLNGPIGLAFTTNFPIVTSKAVTICESYAPNPYTSTVSVGSPVTFQNAQSFQIISSGFDGLYGIGGQYAPSTTSSAGNSLPVDSTNEFYGSTTGSTLSSGSDQSIRQREGDNLTNFKGGSLQ